MSFARATMVCSLKQLALFMVFYHGAERNVNEKGIGYGLDEQAD